MIKVEEKINTYVANFMLDNYNFITDIYVPDKEDFQSYDILYTATTSTGKEIEGTQEVKTINNFPLQEEGEFREYFSNDTCGIKNKMLFGNTPDATLSTDELPKYWLENPYETEIPDNIKEKPIYILNAADVNGNIKNSKWYHMQKNKTGLSLVAKDGILMFNHKQIKEAFMGYGWYLNKSHTELYNKKYNPHYELKAIINLEKGSFYKKDLNKLFKR